MRIFLALNPSSNPGVKNSMTWYRNLYEPLVELKHDVYLLRIDLSAKELKVKRRTKKFKQKFSQKLLDVFKKEQGKKPVDLFFSYLMDSEIEPTCIDEIKKLGVPTANFSCNNTHQFYLTEKIAPHFDFNLHSEKFVAEKFKSIGANPIWFQMAANPKYYHPMDIKRKIDAIFIGAYYSKRPYYIKNLLDNRINIHVYGPGWKYKNNLALIRRIKREIKRSKKILSSLINFSAGRRAYISSNIASIDFRDKLISEYNDNLHFPITDNEMIKKYNESKCVLGFLEVYDVHDYSKRSLQHLHLREFEVPMCGALYFTNYSDELAEHYEPDKEVVIFRNEHELLDKVKYYLSHPREAGKIREAGYKRALECHTYEKRFKEFFKILKK